MEASTDDAMSGSLVAAATTALAVCVGRLAGLALAGGPIHVADGAGVLTFGIVFAGAVARGRRDRNDPALRLACDAITAIGAAAAFYLVPGMMQF